MKLTTKRLILRDTLEKKEMKDVVENINNLKVSRYLAVVPYPYTMKDAKIWFKKSQKRIKERPRTNYNFTIKLKSENKIIGAISAKSIDKYNGTAVLGYWLGEKYWKQGIMSEAMSKMLDFAFNKIKIRRLEANIFTENKASYKLLEKFGFRREGLRKEASRAKATGKLMDDYIYAMLRKEYQKKK